MRPGALSQRSIKQLKYIFVKITTFPSNKYNVKMKLLMMVDKVYLMLLIELNVIFIINNWIV